MLKMKLNKRTKIFIMIFFPICIWDSLLHFITIDLLRIIVNNSQNDSYMNFRIMFEITFTETIHQYLSSYVTECFY